MKKIAIFFLFLVGQAAHANVNEQFNYDYYTVNAEPNRTLLSVITEASPIHENGHTFHGHTSWYVKWHFHWHQAADGRCRMTKVDTDLTATIQLPRLVNPTASQEEQFNRYLDALRTHELGHYENGKEAANEVDQAILALPEMESCKKLESAANDLGHSILKQHNEKDVQYDAETQHGKTQGARLSN
jgi:predicted secreted Zn-dependent protease